MSELFKMSDQSFLSCVCFFCASFSFDHKHKSSRILIECMYVRLKSTKVKERKSVSNKTNERRKKEKKLPN